MSVEKSCVSMEQKIYTDSFSQVVWKMAHSVKIYMAKIGEVRQK
jgi:ribosome-interacting GTPase 1